MRVKNRLGWYSIGVLVFLCCTTTVVHAQLNQNTVLNATVFIETDIGNGTGFYVQPNLIATTFNLISNATEIRAYANERDIGVEAVMAYNAKRNVAILQVMEQGTPLILSQSDGPEPSETIYIAASLSKTDKRFEFSQTIRHTSEDFCEASVKFPIILEINSAGGPVLDISGEVKGIFFIGIFEGEQELFEWEQELAEFHYNFVVPVKALHDLINGTWRVESIPITAKLNYCNLISKANAKMRRAKSSKPTTVERLRKYAKVDLEKASKLLARVKKKPWSDIFKLLRRIFRI